MASLRAFVIIAGPSRYALIAARAAAARRSEVIVAESASNAARSSPPPYAATSFHGSRLGHGASMGEARAVCLQESRRRERRKQSEIDAGRARLKPRRRRWSRGRRSAQPR